MTAGRVAVAVLAVASAVWLLSGSSSPSLSPSPPAPVPTDSSSRVVTGEIRSPDARSPLVRTDGLWRCQTEGTVELRVSSDGLATLSLDGRLLASAHQRRSLINRDCAERRPVALPRFRARRVLPGDSHLRCRVARVVLVDLRDGDLTVRRTRGGFLLGAAIDERELEPTAHWSVPCLVRRSGS
jgi:hypothetical protein